MNISVADDARLRSAKRRETQSHQLASHYRDLWYKGQTWNEKYKEGLVWMYLRDPALVAQVCDTIIDPSGAILLHIRQLARRKREEQS